MSAAWIAGIGAVLAAISALAVIWHLDRGHTTYFGDALSHLAIARRVIDSRTPGLFQIGSVWLPFPHALMIPFVSNDEWWRGGLAGAIPSAAMFVTGGLFLFAGMRRLYGSNAAAVAAALLYALNPNLLYLQAAPMTEAVLIGSWMALFYAVVLFSQTGSPWAMLAAAIASNAASLTRYEGWFAIPFLALYFAIGGKRRPLLGLIFALLASIGPLWWLFHNWWFYGDAWWFYNGPYSAKAIYQRQLEGGMQRYPGDHDWMAAIRQFRAAAELCAGLPLAAMGLFCLVAALAKRAFAATMLFALPVAFYVLSIYSSGTPIFVPQLWPHSYYNIRYGLAAFPLLVFSTASLVALAPSRVRVVIALLVVAIAASPWVAYPRPENWAVWKESQVNSEARRAWTREAAAYMREHYRQGEGIFGTLGDLAGIYREAGIPIREVLHDGNHPWWNAAEARPDFFLREQWAVAIAGDSVATAVQRAAGKGMRFPCVKRISVAGGPVIEIYRRE